MGATKDAPHLVRRRFVHDGTDTQLHLETDMRIHPGVGHISAEEDPPLSGHVLAVHWLLRTNYASSADLTDHSIILHNIGQNPQWRRLVDEMLSAMFGDFKLVY